MAESRRECPESEPKIPEGFILVEPYEKTKIPIGSTLIARKFYEERDCGEWTLHQAVDPKKGLMVWFIEEKTILTTEPAFAFCFEARNTIDAPSRLRNCLDGGWENLTIR